MSSIPLTDLSRLCIHTITTKPWGIEEAAKNYSANGVKGITVWRDALTGRNIKQTGDMLRQDMVCRSFLFAGEDFSRQRNLRGGRQQ